MNPNSDIAVAVRRALFMSAVAATGASTLPTAAQAQEQEADEPEQTVTVTGSRIRRVDEETASPVFVLDANQIAASGVTTFGDILQRVPAISGAATNPQVNNGGGSGEANVELRGLGAQRTLVLLNGRRIGVVSNVQTTITAVDINMIPINMIERIEVLKEGAGAIYGSDAIAGVVNFITRKSFEGAEAGIQLGTTAENDGDNHAVSLLLGSQTDKLSIQFGGNYNKQDEISAGDRDFSKFALYFYGGVVSQGGSSRTPNGRINLPPGGSLETQFGCTSLTREVGAAGATLDDYRCYEPTDAYNYQPFNVLMTPQERAGLFTFLNYNINDSVEAYADVVYSSTRSNSIIASLPFDATQDDVTVSTNSIYNPFGTDFGGILGLNPNVRVRLESLGTRDDEFNTDSGIVNAGLRGKLPADWEWDLNLGFGRMDQDLNNTGYLFMPALRNAVGPSFLDGGVPTCGTPGAPIAGCTPINIFNVTDPEQIAFLQSIQTNVRSDYKYRNQSFSLNLNGKAFEMPAGELLAAVGAEYRNLEGVSTTDVLTRGEPPTFLSCLVSQEQCTGNSTAKYNVREVYSEVFVPLLKERPGIQALNIIAGMRWSDYSMETIGSSTNAQFKLEYRPIADMLLRGSFAEVFRAPTINDLSLAPTQDAPTFNDPCVGLTGAALAANPNLALACEGVVPDSDFTQQVSQITGVFMGSPTLKPEEGDVTTFGIVYDPSQLPGLSFTVDYWRYKLEDLIVPLDPNFAIDQCVATGASQFCDLVFRYTDPLSANLGQIQAFLEPIVNLGVLETDGIDFGVKYALRNTSWGSFQISLDATRTNSFENVPAPGAQPVEVAGSYNRQFGNYAKWRGLLGVGWSMGDIEGLLTARYIHSIKVEDPDGAPGVQPALSIDSTTYLDLSAAYNFPTNTKVQVGITNLTDETPPILFQNNVLNANTDVSTYDLLGRRYFLSVTQKF